jgi:hypothetical protein
LDLEQEGERFKFDSAAAGTTNTGKMKPTVNVGRRADRNEVIAAPPLSNSCMKENSALIDGRWTDDCLLVQ